MRSGNSPQLACWSILAFGFGCYNHTHQLQVGKITTWLKPRRKVRAVRDGASKRARSSDPCVISTVLCLLSYTCIYGAFKLPTQAPSAGTQVFTFIQLAKVFALCFSNFTRQFVYRVRRSVGAPFDFAELHCAYLCIYEINADLRLTNCLIFAHIRPVRRHGLSHR